MSKFDLPPRPEDEPPPDDNDKDKEEQPSPVPTTAPPGTVALIAPVPSPPSTSSQMASTTVIAIHEQPPPDYNTATGLPSYVPQATAPPMQTTVIMGAIPFTSKPQEMDCPFCHSKITTVTKYNNGLLTWFLCMGFALLCCLFCWIPFLCNNWKDVEHSCPNCKRLLGTHKRIN